MSGDRALERADIDAGLKRLTGWSFVDGVIQRSYQTDGWRASMLVAGAVAFICEAADHHADLLVTWPKVTVSLSTHSAGGITEKDFEVARLIEHQVSWRPGEKSALSGRGLIKQ
jgi:pterin-4a-carbinolamine dehydratase